MIDPDYVQCMARYNRWQNDNLYAIADALSEAERRRERGAFFGSIHATLNHLLWADRIWMSRLAGVPSPRGSIPESVSLYDDWGELKHERKAFDAAALQYLHGGGENVGAGGGGVLGHVVVPTVNNGSQ